MSGPLSPPLDITGRPRAGLWVSSDAPEADFILRLADIYPDGYAMILSEGQIRKRGAGEVAIDLTSISNWSRPATASGYSS